MRIRSIKPEIMDDEKTGNLSHEAFRLFAGLILMADDYGNVRHLPARIQGFVFWSETNDGGETTRGMRELLSAELVTLYRVRGQSYLHINGWTKHQKVDKPGPPRCPGPEEADAQEVAAIRERFANQSRISREPLAPDRDLDLDRDRDPDRDHARGPKRNERVSPTDTGAVPSAIAEAQAIRVRALGESHRLADVEARSLRGYVAECHKRGALASFLAQWLGFHSDPWAVSQSCPVSAFLKEPSKYAPKPAITFTRPVVDTSGSIVVE